MLRIVEADGVPAALATALQVMPDAPEHGDDVRAQWPLREPAADALLARKSDGAAIDPQEEELTDERRWPAGVHAGLRRVWEGRLRWPTPVPEEAMA